MKKLSVIILTAMIAMGAQAQVKVAPKMQKGAKVTYKSATTMTLPGVQEPITMTGFVDYTIVDETADGYILESACRDFTTNVKEGDVIGTLMTMGQQLMSSQKTMYQLDKQGQVVGIVNYEELRAKSEAMCDKMVATLTEKIPQITQMMPADQLKAQIMDQMSEENIVKMVKTTPSVLSLNGRTIMTGAQDEYVGQQDLKMKRMYLLTSTDGKKIRTSATVNMSKDELKAMVIKQLEESMPDQVEAIKQNIDAMMDSGMLKMDITETADYTLRDDQWVQTLSVETKSNAMGQESTGTSVIEYVSSNF